MIPRDEMLSFVNYAMEAYLGAVGGDVELLHVAVEIYDGRYNVFLVPGRDVTDEALASMVADIADKERAVAWPAVPIPLEESANVPHLPDGMTAHLCGSTKRR